MSPDIVEEHNGYAQRRFGEALPFIFVSDPDWEIGYRFEAVRKTEHPHGGFWNRTLWIINHDGGTLHRRVPWPLPIPSGGTQYVSNYLELFTVIGSEPGEWLRLVRSGNLNIIKPETACQLGEGLEAWINGTGWLTSRWMQLDHEHASCMYGAANIITAPISE